MPVQRLCHTIPAPFSCQMKDSVVSLIRVSDAPRTQFHQERHNIVIVFHSGYIQWCTRSPVQPVLHRCVVQQEFDCFQIMLRSFL
jgi:hypothetical protein